MRRPASSCDNDGMSVCGRARPGLSPGHARADLWCGGACKRCLAGCGAAERETAPGALRLDVVSRWRTKGAGDLAQLAKVFTRNSISIAGRGYARAQNSWENTSLEAHTGSRGTHTQDSAGGARSNTRNHAARAGTESGPWSRAYDAGWRSGACVV